MVQSILGPAIPEEYIEKIRSDVIISARRQNVVRKLTKVRPIGNSLGIQTWVYDQATEVSDAELSWALTDVGEDVIGLSRSSVNIPVLHKEFKITGRDLEAAALGGFPISTQTAQSAAYKVANLENMVGMVGYAADDTNYDINGFYKSAGNTVSDSYDFGTAGYALAAVAAAVAEMENDEIYPSFNLILNPTQYTQLAISTLGSGIGPSEFGMVKGLIGGEIYSTPYQTAGTGMLMTVPEAGHHEIVVAKDLTTQVLRDEWSGDLKGRVYEAIIPVVYETDAICSLTTI